LSTIQYANGQYSAQTYPDPRCSLSTLLPILNLHLLKNWSLLLSPNPARSSLWPVGNIDAWWEKIAEWENCQGQPKSTLSIDINKFLSLF
jgi:hypothetical protein